MTCKIVLPGIVLALNALSPALAQEFPEGPGKQVFVAVCGSCHNINRARAGYTPEGWRTVARMMQNFGVPVAKDDWPAVTEYLIKNFPERPRPAAAVIPGPVEAAIKLWPVGTPGSRPHDPLASRDGSIWYTGQMINSLGRVDTKTGEVREYRLKIPHSGPHGLAEAQDGAVWFTANHAAYIGRLDPKTGEVAEFRMSDPAARDPHTIAIDRDGIVWFTVQNGNRLGRIAPQSGEVKLVVSPTPKSRPYGLAINAKGVPVFVEFGTNKIATIDPKTMAIREYILPNPRARPRRLAIAPDGAVWYTDFARGFLGRLDLGSGAVREWASPSGPRSQPYGIVSTKGALWYNESGAKPNTIVRFDPRVEKFQSWAIPGGGDIVRNMDVTKEGNPVLANSLVNQVGLVEVK